ncbi:hypothetical protein PAMC26510_05545 [Caballeronia sordidicola]|uniref:Uncharacterized protein n=1 Tax=Caballeronia sordidicola TaxID=196367 RepID=A0A242N7W9_CABSO|nr:hypothetical protein PAMC26510_05545 [Caballeronia sordidicola]
MARENAFRAAADVHNKELPVINDFGVTRKETSKDLKHKALERFEGKT